MGWLLTFPCHVVGTFQIKVPALQLPANTQDMSLRSKSWWQTQTVVLPQCSCQSVRHLMESTVPFHEVSSWRAGVGASHFTVPKSPGDANGGVFGPPTLRKPLDRALSCRWYFGRTAVAKAKSGASRPSVRKTCAAMLWRKLEPDLRKAFCVPGFNQTPTT